MSTEAAFFDRMDDFTELEYVGFWLRLWAGIVDSVLLMMVLIPLTLAVFGSSHLSTVMHVSATSDFLMSWVLPALLIFAVWTGRNRTFGMTLISAEVVDEKTSGPPSPNQHVGRYLGYFLAAIPFGLGLLWVAFDSKKQGWHDKLAGTVVIRRTRKK